MFFESKNYHWERLDENLERALVGYDSSLMLTIVKFKKIDYFIITYSYYMI